jgi:hypothetical protein
MVRQAPTRHLATWETAMTAHKVVPGARLQQYRAWYTLRA